MIRLPEDVENELIEMYPEANVKAIIQSLFASVLKKTLKDGCCNIREFGKFLSHKTVSAKLATEVIRFKFKISPALERSIKTDKYLLNNIPIKAKIPFTDENKKYCNNDIKIMNTQAQIEASRLGVQLTKEKVMSNRIMDLINE